MSYASTRDFLGLLRQTSGGERNVSMPGLDWLIAALSRANIFALWVGQVAPPVPSISTLWFRPSASGSWAAEGAVFLFNQSTAQYEPATPTLWAQLFTAPVFGYVFQSITAGAGAINANTTLLAIQRAAPAITILSLPSVTVRSNRALQIVDWSTAVTGHAITLNAAAGETVMRLASWQMLSSADQLAGLTLYPSIDLLGWVIAP